MRRLRAFLFRVKYILTCVVLILAAVFCPAAGAAQIQVEADTGAEMGSLMVSGKIEQPRGIVTLMILPESVKPEQLSEELLNQEKYVIKNLRADSDGIYGTRFVLPEEMPSGAYTLYAADRSGQTSILFSHVNPGQAQRALERINAAEKSEMQNALRMSCEDLAIDMEILNRYGTVMGSLLYAGRPQNGYTMAGLLLELDRATALGMVRDNQAEEAFLQYDAAFGMDYKTEYQPLSARVKSCFVKQVQGNTLEIPAEKIVFEALIFARVSAADSYLEAQTAILENREVLKWDFSDYNRLTVYQQGRVFAQLVSAECPNYGALYPEFCRIVRSLEERENTGQNAGGRPSGGGGGGGGGGAVSGEFSDAFQVEQETASKPAETPPARFSDLDGHWSRKSVEVLAKRGVVAGYEDGTFRPEQPVTRGEFSKLIGLALNLAPGEGDMFSDVTEKDWFYPYVYGAEKAGLIQGYAGLFLPDAEIIREDCAVILYRALERRGKAPEGGFEFSDSGEIADYAQKAVGAMAAAELIQGYAGCFNPKAISTRAEAVGMIEKTLRFLGEV